MKKLRNGLLLLLIIFMAIGIAPLVKAAGHDASVNGSKGGKLRSNNSNTKWPSPYYYAIRMTAINNDGTRVANTHSVVFANANQVGALKSSLYRNQSISSTKWHVLKSGITWKKRGASKGEIQKYPDGYSVVRKNGSWKANGSMPAKHFKKVAANPTEFKKYLELLKYNYEGRSAEEVSKQYIVIEPMTVVMISGKKYFGTSTELNKLNSGGPAYSARTAVGITMCYTGSFNKAAKPGETVGGVKLQYEITDKTKLKAYKTGKLSSKGGCKAPSRDEILQYSGGRSNGNAIGIFHISGNGGDPEPPEENICEYDNPLNFHTESNDLELANPNCCAEALEELTQKLGSAAKAREKLYADYPVCRYSPIGDCYKNQAACDATPKHKNPVCKNNQKESIEIVKDSDNWNNIFANKQYQSYYKVADASTKYCYVYCSEKIYSSFPASYTGKASPGNVFIWPRDYDTILKNTTTCKVRVRNKEWEADYEDGAASLNDINKCNDDSILTTSVKGVYQFAPTVKLTYQTGNGSKVDGETLKTGNVKKESKDTGSKYEETETTEANAANENGLQEAEADIDDDLFLDVNLDEEGVVDISTQMGDRSRISIDKYKEAVEKRKSTFSSTIGYLLPSDFYQYVSKINKGWIRKLGGKFDSGKYIDTKSSHLYVSDKAIINKKYDLILNYGGLSAFKNKAKVNYFAGDYKCKYTPTQPNSTCDPNEKTHFVRNGVTITDGGPHGENCCSDIAKRYGADSTVYKKLVEQGWCGTPKTPKTPKTDCDYNNPNDFANKLNDPTDKSAENGNCCNMVKNDPSPDAQAAYKKYCPSDICCPGDYNDDGTCANGDMTKQLRACVNSGKSYDECEKNNCPYGRRVIYRPIDLKDPFPGVKDTNRIQTKKWQLISNWSSKTTVSSSPSEKVKRYITNNRGVKEDSVYNLSPMYIIKLNPRTVASVKSYNLTTSYDDFNMKCDSNGRKCRSEYIQKLKSQNIISGCGTDKSWYSCQGVEESRGD